MKKRISAVILAGAIMVSCTSTFAQSLNNAVPISAAYFTDINGHWSNSAVQMLIKKDAIPFDQDKFIPNKAITRSEFAVMLHNAMDIHIEYLVAPDIKDYFEDVDQNAPYSSELIDLVTAGILDDEGKAFNPDATLAREQMIHYIMNAYKYKMGDRFAYIKIKGGYFADHDKITPEYSGNVDYAAYLKLITGVGQNLFSPKSNATRAEAAVVTSKLMNIVEKQSAEIVIVPALTQNKDSLEMVVSITNKSQNPVTFNHSSGQKFDFVLYDENDRELYRWSDGKAFTMMLVTSVIKAGETVEYSDVLEGEAYSSIKDRISYMKAYVIGSSDSFTIDSNGYEARIK